MKNSFFISAFLLLLSLSCKQGNDSQAIHEEETELSDSLPASGEVTVIRTETEGSFYEYGDSIISYETNFKNLFNNWTIDRLNNAEEYELLGYSFVETISDSATYKPYRSYYSTGKSVGSGVERGTSEKVSFDTTGQKTQLDWTSKLIVRPGYSHEELRNPNNLPEALKKILTKEFSRRALKLLTDDLSIDSMDLQYHSYFHSEKEFTETDYPLKTIGWAETRREYDLASQDSLSQNYIDVLLTGKKTMEQLPPAAARDLFLEQIMIGRIGAQLDFNETVSLGDRVYKIDFTHNEEPYTNYVILDSDTKKVIVDTFFKGIRFDLPPEY